MGKRSNKKRRKLDFYPTPFKAVPMLIPHLNGVRSFGEPCCGDGRLVRHLESFGLICVYAGDIAAGQDALARDDYGAIDAIVTNPPFTHEVLAKLLPHFMRIAPAWLLLPMDFASNVRDAPYLAACTDVVPFGRVQWIDGTEDTSKDNFGWFRFQLGHRNGPVIHPRGTTTVTSKLGQHGGARRKGQKQSYNVPLKNRGNSRAYILARLDRDGHTELASGFVPARSPQGLPRPQHISDDGKSPRLGRPDQVNTSGRHPLDPPKFGRQRLGVVPFGRHGCARRELDELGLYFS
jgi:hypothetical protein